MEGISLPRQLRQLDRQLHVSGISGDHALYQMFWDGSKWSGWFCLGDHIIDSPAAGDIQCTIQCFCHRRGARRLVRHFCENQWRMVQLEGLIPSAPAIATYLLNRSPEQ